jgi:hypothetical protein
MPAADSDLANRCIGEFARVQHPFGSRCDRATPLHGHRVTGAQLSHSHGVTG